MEEKDNNNTSTSIISNTITPETAQMFRDNEPRLNDRSDDEIFKMERFHVTNAGRELEIGALANLLHLKLSEPKVIHKSIDRLKKIESLSIYSKNKITCLPTEIGKLKSIKKLTLCCGSLVNIPCQALSLGGLESLWLENISNDMKHLPLRGLPSGCKIFMCSPKTIKIFQQMFFPRWGKIIPSGERTTRIAGMHLRRKALDTYYHKVDAAIFGVAKSYVIMAKTLSRARERMYRPGATGYLSEKRKWSEISSNLK